MTDTEGARRHDCLIDDCPHRSVGHFELWLGSGTVAGASGFCALHAEEAYFSSDFFAEAIYILVTEVQAARGLVLKVTWISEGFFQ